MNKALALFAILILMAGHFISCKKDSSNPAALPVTASNIAGEFTATSFSSSGNEAATFSGYQFTFLETGIVTAVKDGITYNGTWRLDDSDASELKLSFGNTPLNELNKGWHIAEFTTDHMLLTDDSDSHEGDDDNPSSHEQIRFQRN